jgi:phosphomannomutase
MFSAAVASGLLVTGCRVTELGVVMTPTLAHAIRAGRYAGGVNITASHNPLPWNGLKFLDDRGLAPDPQRAAEIARIRDNGKFRYVTDRLHALQTDDLAGERHVDAVLAAVEANLTPLRGIRVVLDSVNGAGCLDSPALLTSLGCDLIHLNGEPTGQFAHAPEPLAENLSQLCDAVRASRAAIGFAQDPDGDRLAIVDGAGRYVGEELTLALAVQSVLMRRPGPVAANLSTSRLVDDLARRAGVRVIRTPVGEANVARAMLEHDCAIGGEGNGGVIDPRISLVRDSLSAMSLVLQLMAATGTSLAQLADALPRYRMIKQKVECPRERIDAAVERTGRTFAGSAGVLAVDRSDGVRVDFAEGWVHLRASNTEPIVRVIAEAADERTAAALVARVRGAAGL